MSGRLDHSPAKVIKEMLIDLSSGSATSLLDSDWSVYVSSIPDSPDKIVVVTDTTGKDDGRSMIDGYRMVNHGFQILIRSQTFPEGYQKANEIAIDLDGVVRRTVVIGSSVYLVHSISRVGDVIAVGTEVPASQRQLFTINARVTLDQTS